MKSCIYEGRVDHRRFHPVAHAFRYRVFMLYLDLDELSRVFEGRWLWTVDRPGLASFRRGDHYGDPGRPLSDEIRDLVAERGHARPEGPIRLLTHMRYLGHCFNPVSFYYCFEAGGESVRSIVAEVANTPWAERHCYVLDESDNRGHGTRKEFTVGKRLHVSPFMPMNVDYEWRLGEPGERLGVYIRNRIDGSAVFDASLALRRTPITSASLAGVLLRYPPMTLRVVASIYWQALRLWFKRVPVHDHPDESPRAEQRP